MSGSSRLRSQRGFTLVEMLVSIFVGMTVLFAVFGVLELSARQSQRATDRIEANQRGRTAMEQLVQELHSSCVAANVTPVQTGSDSNNLSFISQFGSAAVLTPNLHTVSFSGGTITDTTYAATGGSAPSWTFSSTPTSSKVLLTNASQGAVGGLSQPVFQYFKYVNGALSTSALSTPLSASDAAATAEVTITFAANPTFTSNEADRTVNLTDSVVLRLAPPSATSTVANVACQ